MTRCLVVQPNAALAEFVRRALRDRDVETEVTATIAGAVALLEACSTTCRWFDAALLDARTPFDAGLRASSRLPVLTWMPGRSGNFVEYVARGQRIGCTFVSGGYMDLDVIAEFKRSGASGFIRKGPGFIDRLLNDLGEWERTHSFVVPYPRHQPRVSAPACALTVELNPAGPGPFDFDVSCSLQPFIEGPPGRPERLSFPADLADAIAGIDRLYWHSADPAAWSVALREAGVRMAEVLGRSRRFTELLGQGLDMCRRKPEELSIEFAGPASSLRLPFELALEGSEHLFLRHRVSRRISPAGRQAKPLDELVRGQTLRILLVAAYSYGPPGKPPRGVSFRGAAGSATPGMLGEVAVLRERLEGVSPRWTIEVLDGKVTAARLEAALSDPVDVVHLCCHGGHNPKDPDFSGLALWDERGQRVVPLSALRLRAMLSASQARFAYLSCCHGADTSPPAPGGYFSGLLQAAVVSGVPGALAFRWPLLDDFATEFADAFYREWLACGSLSLAVHRARVASSLKALREHYCWAGSIFVSHDSR